MNTFDTHGGHFAPQGYLKVEEGGSHEENPNGGVQLGVDQQGIPNMLEEDEPVYDDYVYSDNIVASKDMLKKHNLHEKYAGKKYSEIADIYVDEAENRPNDPISNNGLNAMLVRLADAQEEQKAIQKQLELEEELSKLSPEELAELEAMLGQEEQAVEPQMQEQTIPPMGNEQMMRTGGWIDRDAPIGMETSGIGKKPIHSFGKGGTSYNIYNLLKDVNPHIEPTAEERMDAIIGTNVVKEALAQAQADKDIQDHEPVAFVPRKSKADVFTSDYLHHTKPSGAKPTSTDTDEENTALPIWPRYAGAVTSGLLGLHNALQEPDHYDLPAYTPTLPYGRLHLVDPVYNPVDESMLVNDVLAQSAGTARGLMNSGLGPSTGATLLALDYNTGRNLGAARTQARATNAQLKNTTLAGINDNRSALGQFGYKTSTDRASVLNDAMLRNMQNNLLLQRLNNDAESEKYAAVANQIDQVGKAISGIGNENFAMNQIGSVYDYGYGDNGKVKYNKRKCGGTLLKKVKK